MQTDSQTSEERTEQYPLLTDRIQSTFIDTVFIVFLLFVFASWLNRYENVPDWTRIILFAALAIYEPLFTSLGGTLGNYIKGIRVRRYQSPGRKINFFQAFLRYGIKLSLGWISFLTIHSNKNKRAIHDLASGSIMIMK
jgi:uncharacterized RDD family membrane protein YckC